MQAKPYHSVTRFLHHVYPDCEIGSQIAAKDLAEGTGSKPMCRLCFERKKAEEKQLTGQSSSPPQPAQAITHKS